MCALFTRVLCQSAQPFVTSQLSAFKTELRTVNESMDCTVLEDFKGVQPELKAGKLETI